MGAGAWALRVPPPARCQCWSNAPTHTRPLGAAGAVPVFCSWRPSGKEQLRLFLAFLEEPPLERERGL